MAQHDYNIANAGGATVRADINNVLEAIQSLNSGTGAPSSTVAGMLWLDTSGGLPYELKIRDGGNNHWLSFASITDPGSDSPITLSDGVVDTNGPASIQTLTSGTTYSTPSGVKRILVYCTGAGGGGGGDGGTGDVGACGGAGGTAIKIYDVSSTSSITYAIGAGGAGGAAGANNGS